MINKAYKFRIYPTAKQKELIEKTFGCTRFIYNHFLDQRIELYEKEGESISYTEQQNQLPGMKKEREWLKEVDSSALQMATRNLDTAFQNFFDKKECGYPKFKSKKYSKKSYTTSFTNNNIKVKKVKVRLPKLKWIKANAHRYVEGVIKRATVSKSSTGKYYVAITVEVESIEKLPQKDTKIGIDLGLTDFAVLSDGQKIKSPKYLKNSLKKLKREQRKLSRKQKFSNNWYKQKSRVAKIHEKIKNQRKDFLHKLSKKIIDENQVIVLEDLKVKEMMEDKKLAKEIADASWYKFYSYIKYKAKWYGRIVYKIDQWFPSSKTCRHCGHVIEKLPLHKRKWDCPNCQAKAIDRDYNASMNILVQGLKEMEIKKVA